MTYLKLSIDKINNNISNYKKAKENFINDTNSMYESLGYIDSAWNDSNSQLFKDKLKSDKSKLYDYFLYLDKLYSEQETFVRKITEICSKNGYRNSALSFKFDDSEISNCMSKLDNAINILDDCLNELTFGLFDLNMGCLVFITVTKNSIKNLKQRISNLKNSIKSITNSVNNELLESRNRMRKIEKYNFDIKQIEFNSAMIDLNIVDSELHLSDVYNPKNIDNRIKSFKTQNQIHTLNAYNTPTNEINLNKISQSDNLSENVDQYATRKNEINYNSDRYYNETDLKSNVYDANAISREISKDIETENAPINDNVISNNSNVSKVNYEYNSLNEDLSKDTSEYFNKENKVDYGINKYYNQTDLKSHVYDANVISREISKDIETENAPINDNVVFNNSASSSINYSFTNVNGLNKDIVDYKDKNTKIDYSMQNYNNYNLNNGIKDVSVNQNNISGNIVSNAKGLDSNVNKVSDYGSSSINFDASNYKNSSSVNDNIGTFQADQTIINNNAVNHGINRGSNE